MTVSRWRDSGHLERAVETADGPPAFDAAVAAMLDDARGWRLGVVALAIAGWALVEGRRAWAGRNCGCACQPGAQC